MPSLHTPLLSFDYLKEFFVSHLVGENVIAHANSSCVGRVFQHSLCVCLSFFCVISQKLMHRAVMIFTVCSYSGDL